MSWRKFRSLAASTLILIIVTDSETASADDDNGRKLTNFYAAQTDGASVVSAKSVTLSIAIGPQRTAPSPVQRASEPVLEWKVVPACRGNEASAADGFDALCQAAVEYCATVGQQGISYWVFTRQAGSTAGWRMAGQRCLTAQQAGDLAGTPAPVVTAEEFRRLPLPAGVVHIQPGNGRTLVNVPTNVYLDATVRQIPTAVLGQQIQVRAIPIEYQWTFGDGGTLRTTDPGAPFPDLRTTHTYTVPGTVPVGLTTTYRGEYSVAGGAWLPIDGTAQVTTPSVPLIVVAARGALVDSALPS